MTDTVTPPVPHPPTGETLSHLLDTPLYASLARAFLTAGRSVPGQPDLVWEILTGRPGRHRAPIATGHVPDRPYDHIPGR